MSIEIVTWLDAETRDGWRDHGEAATDMSIDSLEAQAIGWVIAETPDRLVLTSMRNDRSYASSVGIPKVAITKREVLRK